MINKGKKCISCENKARSKGYCMNCYHKQWKEKKDYQKD